MKEHWPDDINDFVDLYVFAEVDPGGRPRRPCKVGVSRDWTKRRAQIQTAFPRDIDLVRVFSLPTREVAFAVEREFQGDAEDARSREAGEWYEIDPIEVVFFLASIIEKLLQKVISDARELSAFLDYTGVDGVRKSQLLKMGQCRPTKEQIRRAVARMQARQGDG